jgi:DNA-binding NarL/FixJ family response regulator
MASRILIADEHRLMRDNVRTLIESHPGWTVCAEAEDGEEAVTKAAALSPDAIILALAMPRMNGFEAACQINKTAPRTPIILHTKYSSPAVERAAQMMGIYKVTSKNNSIELFAELERLFSSTPPRLVDQADKPRASQLNQPGKRRVVLSGQTELIRDLHELLESYAPMWYSDELDARVREMLTKATLSTESSQGTKPHAKRPKH